MLFKPKKIVESLGSKWIRYKFSRPSCTICNNKYCYIPILITSHTIDCTIAGNLFILNEF